MMTETSRHLPTRGVLYSATGSKHRAEAIISARSVKRHMPDLSITLCSDAPPEDTSIFDRFCKIENPDFSYADKIAPTYQFSYQETLFLDSDTYITSSVLELYDLLDQFDLAITHHPCRSGPDVGCPDSFPEFNTGVVLFRRVPAVQIFFQEWNNRHRKFVRERFSSIGDQASFRQVLYESDLRYFVLATEYNYCTFCPNFAGCFRDVKILHGFPVGTNDWETFAQRINHTQAIRLFLPSLRHLTMGTLQFYQPSSRRFLKLLILLLRCLGITNR